MENVTNFIFPDKDVPYLFQKLPRYTKSKRCTYLFQYLILNTQKSYYSYCGQNKKASAILRIKS